jgi:hypothetical protein
MADVHYRSIQTRVRFETSIDLLQKQTYSTGTIAGVRRSYEASTVETIPSHHTSALVRVTKKHSSGRAPDAAAESQLNYLRHLSHTGE